MATFGSYITTFSLIVFLMVIYKAFVGFSWSTSFFRVFALDAALGLVEDYKILRGTTVNNNTDSVRVYSDIRVERPATYKNTS